jgi:hypothetical protein
MKRALRALLLGCAALQALPVLASELTLAPSPAACLSSVTGERGTPEYPQEQWTSGTPGRVRVELTFTGPALRPEVTVLSGEGGPEFVESVRRHVRDLRLPCLEAAAVPARVRIDFVFNPVERKSTASEPLDPDRAENERQLACVVNGASARPTYPVEARRSGLQGRVLLEMRFVNADGPPDITLVARPGSKDFFPSVKTWAEQFRMPCYAGRPVPTRWTLVYRLEGDERYGFKKVSLVEFISSIRGIDTEWVDFDFNTMGCPFEIRLQYLQPQRRSRVVQIDEPNARRQPFLDWMAGAELKLNDKQQDAVFGDTVVLTVPCGKFKLQPKTGAPAPR